MRARSHPPIPAANFRRECPRWFALVRESRRRHLHLLAVGGILGGKARLSTTRCIVEGAVENAGQQRANDSRLGSYEIIRRLARGGMAELFLARMIGQGGFEKVVAL